MLITLPPKYLTTNQSEECPRALWTITMKLFTTLFRWDTHFWGHCPAVAPLPGKAVKLLTYFTQSFLSPRLKWVSGFECVLVTQSCLTLCDPMNYSPPGSSVHEILQARILQWAAIFFSKEPEFAFILRGSFFWLVSEIRVYFVHPDSRTFFIWQNFNSVPINNSPFSFPSSWHSPFYFLSLSVWPP